MERVKHKVPVPPRTCIRFEILPFVVRPLLACPLIADSKSASGCITGPASEVRHGSDLLIPGNTARAQRKVLFALHPSIRKLDRRVSLNVAVTKAQDAPTWLMMTSTRSSCHWS